MIRRIIIGVTGGIAAYKSIDMTSLLKKEGFEIKVILTRNAMEFVRELTFHVLSKNRVYTEMFNSELSVDTDHIELAKWGDIMLIYPATANIIGKIYCGIADDLLSTVVLAMPGKYKIICPAMNTNMWENPVVQRNIDYISSLDSYHFIDPVSKKLACGDIGKGALCEPRKVLGLIQKLDKKLK